MIVIDIDSSVHHVTQAGLLYVYGDKSITPPPTLMEDAARIPDYGRNLKRPAAIRDRLERIGYITESRFDAAHGRRYVLIAYRNGQGRRVAMAAADGIANLRQYHIDCGAAL